MQILDKESQLYLQAMREKERFLSYWMKEVRLESKHKRRSMKHKTIYEVG